MSRLLESGRFLAPPESPILGSYDHSPAKRYVVRRVLVRQSPYFRCDTVKNRYAPHTFKMSKTLNKAWEADHIAWLSRCATAGENLAAIGHGALKQLLVNKYNDCVELRLVRHGLMAVISERPSPRTKGRTQIIDLSEY